MKERRVLVVAYFFPPLGGGGVQRTLKHVRYLPAAGWQPVVVAPRDPRYEPRDEALAREIPSGTVVVRSFCPEPARLYGPLLRAVRWLGRARQALRPTRADPLPVDGRPTDGGGARSSAPADDLPRLSVLARLSRLVFFPDEHVGWLPFAVRSALAVHARDPVDAIYSSSPPITPHLIAGLVKRRTGARWVADLRDPWVGNPFVPPLPWPHRWLQRRIERWIVERADAVVFATPTLRADYAARYPRLADRFVTITNGYDRADLAPRASRARSSRDPFVLVYAGTLYGERGLGPFLDGVRLAVDADPSLRARLRIQLVGWLDQRNQAIVADHADLGPMLDLPGFVPRAEALERVGTADATLLLIGSGRGNEVVLTGKLFEYLGADKQILAMVPEGDARELLRSLDWGVIVDPDPRSVADGLRRLLDAPPPDRPADPDGRYERSRLAARLAEILGPAHPEETSAARP